MDNTIPLNIPNYNTLYGVLNLIKKYNNPKLYICICGKLIFFTNIFSINIDSERLLILLNDGTIYNIIIGKDIGHKHKIFVSDELVKLYQNKITWRLKILAETALSISAADNWWNGIHKRKINIGEDQNISNKKRN